MKKLQLTEGFSALIVKRENQSWLTVYKKGLGITIPIPPSISVSYLNNFLLFNVREDLSTGNTCFNKVKKVLDYNFSFFTSVNVEGVAFKVMEEKGRFIFSLGYSHLITWKPATRTSYVSSSGSGLKIQSKNPQVVGELCSFLAQLRKPSVYGDKGVFILTKKHLFKRTQFKKSGKNKVKSL